MEKREGQPQPIDLTELFVSGSESEFMERLHSAGSQEARIEIRLDQLVANLWLNRLKKFLDSGDRTGGKRVVVIEASRAEAEMFRSRYPRAEWKITDPEIE